MMMMDDTNYSGDHCHVVWAGFVMGGSGDHYRAVWAGVRVVLGSGDNCHALWEGFVMGGNGDHCHMLCGQVL